MQENTATTSSTRLAKAEFTGKSGEFFKIWIVNILLTILTLGIYSAWAKVRTNQYLHGHTKLEGHSFKYLATPLQILKGRILAVIVFLLFSFLSTVNPLFSVLLTLLLLCATPWLIVQGLKFSMRMTAYRNIRFSFEGKIGDVVVNFIVLPILSVFTLYLILPWVFQRMDKFIFDNITYGGKKFNLKTDVGQYFVAALTALAFVIIAIIAIAVVGGVAAFQMVGLGESEEIGTAAIMAIFGLYAVMFALYFVAFAIYRAMILKHITDSLEIESIATFSTDMKVVDYIFLSITNSLMLIASFGLAYPITVVRKNRFIASHLSVELTEDADKLVNTVDGKDAAFGEEAAGLFDADLSFT
ncbi:DUF898 domain-containing protein [Shewanella sp. 202IG2-18]|uniref:YjgN family protein n=1 Tax=Parashewanella hymeniacidonis TaxID=2807618 RepID=UPI001960582A|nr:YjgN family protein [Parashewanella hymeniacidonis]MBM7073282.1 DUF898 domain-containing protein [Parashewanella hymeniacidonis]